MGHCQLGRAGARALKNALIINTVITELDLKNNGLDSVVSGSYSSWMGGSNWGKLLVLQ